MFAEVPAIIEPQVFEHVQSQLKARNPRITAPRVVTGPVLLTLGSRSAPVAAER